MTISSDAKEKSPDSLLLTRGPVVGPSHPGLVPQPEKPAAWKVRPRLGVQCTTIDPASDDRWEALVQRHPRASVFHSTAWLTALQQTYGYRPFAYVTFPEMGDLRGGMIFCPIESWLTGRRLVSLPFSDHCEPLIDDPKDLQLISTRLRWQLALDKWRYVEMRTLDAPPMVGFERKTLPACTWHRIDLRPELSAIFSSFHKSSTQRKIRRAEREELIYKESSGIALLDPFYRLFTATRRRHHVPPQPKNWFRSLAMAFGGLLKIRVAFRGSQPIAAMLTIRHKDTMVYKYGGSDPKFNALGGMHLLFWQTIREAKSLGLRSFDLGRSDVDQPGLATFKRRWGAVESSLVYGRYHLASNPSLESKPAENGWETRIAKAVLKHVPAWSLSMMGGILYKHVG
jgi:CelD/BcsL family acetyltransferase involved in cellulose biosynthesis